jgi:hypothetical protein
MKVVFREWIWLKLVNADTPARNSYHRPCTNPDFAAHIGSAAFDCEPCSLAKLAI